MNTPPEHSGGPHQAVLLEEAVEALCHRADGVYVDATFGRGGHTEALLRRLGDGARVIALDRDPEAVAYGRSRFAGETRLELVQSSFSRLRSLVVERNLLGALSGVLLDLGVSSPQLDDAGRGFSFMRDGPLDMRMSNDAGPSAADWLNSAGEEEIQRVLRELGEERFARRIARAIVQARQESALSTTAQLAEIVRSAVPARDQGKHPATRTFQAIRLYINDELGELQKLLADIPDLLAPGGRLVVISFHSLEDRIVKRFMRDHSRAAALPREIPMSPGVATVPLRVIGKPVRAAPEEVAGNPRARSAIMRVAERVAEMAA